MSDHSNLQLKLIFSASVILESHLIVCSPFLRKLVSDVKLQKKHKKRKRRGKLPKNYDPNVAPDPERWLPRHERSGFRKKRDRRNRDNMKGTQGAATGASDL